MIPIKPGSDLIRRQFLFRLALAGLPLGGSVTADELKSWDLGFLSGSTILTPNDRFFVRNHFEAPVVDAANWKVAIGGSVRRPLEISYPDILKHPRRNLTVTVECAGNEVGGGAVSTATWTGISLQALLNEAGLEPGVRFVRLIGADQGVIDRPLKRPIPYGRSIPLDKALSHDTILAFEMNGAPLGVEHGHPLRAIVPGRYGMDSVKWIVAMEALDKNDLSYFMTARYVTARLLATGAERTPVARMLVKSQITKPREGETLPAGLYTIRGVAWAGENKISKVEVSFDAGSNWIAANLETQPSPYTWVLWQCPYRPPGSGEYTIVVRATDTAGRTQPSSRDRLRFDQYENNSYHAVHCKVV